MNAIVKYAAVHAAGAAAYIGAIATVMANGEHLFGSRPPVALAITLFLSAFVVSAAVMGLLIFARPVMWYLDGRKKEALSLAVATVAFLALIGVLIFLMVLFYIL